MKYKLLSIILNLFLILAIIFTSSSDFACVNEKDFSKYFARIFILKSKRDFRKLLLSKSEFSKLKSSFKINPSYSKYLSSNLNHFRSSTENVHISTLRFLEFSKVFSKSPINSYSIKIRLKDERDGLYNLRIHRLANVGGKIKILKLAAF